MSNKLTVQDVFPDEVMNDRELTAVDGRALWKYLEMDMSHFNRDMKTSIDNAMFEVGVDYALAIDGDPLNRGIGGTPRTDYVFTADAGKELAMMSHKPNGKLVRKYFIASDKRRLELEKSKNQVPMMTDIEKYQTMLDQAKTIVEIQNQNTQLQLEQKDSVRANNQGYKAQYNKRTKQYKTIQACVGVEKQKDILATISTLNSKARKYDILKERHDQRKLEKEKLQQEKKVVVADRVSELVTVTELGMMYADSDGNHISAIKMNKLLAYNEMQEKVNKKWVPTAQGEDLSQQFTVYSADGYFLSTALRWNTDVLKSLK